MAAKFLEPNLPAATPDYQPAALQPASRSRTVISSRTAPQQPRASQYEPWPQDEVEWFLDELGKPDRGRDYLEVCAETLDRPVEEVRAERERLRRLGVYRSPR
jgi:hypothetical protein